MHVVEYVLERPESREHVPWNEAAGICKVRVENEAFVTRACLHEVRSCHRILLVKGVDRGQGLLVACTVPEEGEGCNSNPTRVFTKVT